jgi:hypothetical protein
LSFSTNGFSLFVSATFQSAVGRAFIKAQSLANSFHLPQTPPKRQKIPRRCAQTVRGRRTGFVTKDVNK